MIFIIIPAYNAEKTIKKCLLSIFNQTLRDFELVVVNDGSVDRTAEIVRSVTKRRPPSLSDVKMITQDNAGSQAARNRGWEECRMQNAECRMVLFCDADIVLRKDCLEKMVHALEDCPSASYAYSSFKFGWKTFKLGPFDAKRLRQMPYVHTTSLIRVEHFPGWDESIKRLQDWDLWLTMLEQGHTGVWVPENLFQVINTKGTMSKWLPSFVYRLPWKTKAVRKYEDAVQIIREKHKLYATKPQATKLNKS